MYELIQPSCQFRKSFDVQSTANVICNIVLLSAIIKLYDIIFPPQAKRHLGSFYLAVWNLSHKQEPRASRHGQVVA